MSDISAVRFLLSGCSLSSNHLRVFSSCQRVELKRLEHERQRHLQRKMFEDQMRALEQQQAQELLSIPHDPNAPNGNSLQHLAASAPTTPPRVTAGLNEEHPVGVRFSAYQAPMDVEILSKAVGFAVSDKRKSVTYGPAVNHSPDLAPGTAANGFSRAAGAKSMPASRRTSASEHDDELAGHLQGLSLAGDRSKRASPAPGNAPHSILTKGSGRYGNEEALRYGTAFNAGMMLDEQLDQEMHSEQFLLSCVPFGSDSWCPRCYEEPSHFR